MKNNLIICSLIITIIGLSTIQAQTDTIPPATPGNVQAFGYEKNVDIDWYHNSETDLAGYKIYKWNGNAYTLYTSVSKDKSYLTLNVGVLGISYSFKVSAYDVNGNESLLSDSVDAETHLMTDEEFLDMVQRSTFRYFYDYGHPVSGLSRERLGSGETVTSGGSGFGLMALIVGVEREYITREQGVERMLKILNFLKNNAAKFHGAFSHWLNGTSGAAIPFSQYDDGGDLVETSFLIQGVLTVRQYFDAANANEEQIRNLCTELWEGVEWSWYRRTSFSNYLYWHWSPNYAWQMNFKLVGWMETMITYMLGIASPTYGVPASLFHNGWASLNYTNNNSFYGYRLWVGPNYGGPLFFAHYSFMGFDPRNKKDAYCNYFLNNKNHTLINRAYCIANPYNHTDYGPNNWGLTASDEPNGYSAHAPYDNDNGTITPTAALSSMPYTPLESIEALKHFYRTYGSNVWGEFGFKDAFNPKQNWFASSYLAIDQGPIIVMIENYRSGLLWNKFMANPEIQPMLDSIGFVPDSVTSVDEESNTVDDFKLIGNYPNPFNPSTTIVFNLPISENVSIEIFNYLGEKIREISEGQFSPGENKVEWDGLSDENNSVSSGIYLYKISTSSRTLYGKMILQK
jgi:hypothetical protein